MIDLNNSKLTKLNGSFPKANDKPSLTMIIEKDVFVMLLLGHMSWNMADGAFFHTL